MGSEMCIRDSHLVASRCQGLVAKARAMVWMISWSLNICVWGVLNPPTRNNSLRFATYTASDKTFYGVVTEKGMVALSQHFPEWPSLYDVIKANGLGVLADKAQHETVTHTEFVYEMVLPDAPRILCVGVNFPDRNAEYKDGSAQPQYMSLFPRFASGFTGHERPLTVSYTHLTLPTKA